MMIFAYITLAAGLAYFVWQTRRDNAKSALQRLHLPPGERNPLARGKDGYFDPKKATILDICFVGGGLAAAFLTPWEYSPFLMGGIFFAWGLYVMDGIRKDIERLERNKVRQIAILTALRSDPDGDHVPDPRPQGFGKSIVWVSTTFYDFYVPMEAEFESGKPWSPEMFADQRRAKEIITSRLKALAQLSESEWFTTERSKRV